MKKTNLSIILGAAVSISLLLVISVVYPSVDDLWVENPFWNGLSTFYSELDPKRMSVFSDLDALYNPRNSTLFIIGPYKDLTSSEVVHLTGYLDQGGTLVLCDDFGTGNNILENLQLEVRFNLGLLRDPVFREKNNYMPKVTASLADIGYIILNYPTVLSGIDAEFVSVWSSPVSYVSLSEDGPMVFESYPVMASISYSAGKIVVLSDSSVFINSMINLGENKALLLHLAQGTVIIDEAHSSSSKLSIVKSFISKTSVAFTFYEIRYGILLAVLFGVFRFNLSVKETPVDPVEALIQRHPEYDRKQLEYLQNERRRRIKEN